MEAVLEAAEDALLPQPVDRRAEAAVGRDDAHAAHALGDEQRAVGQRLHGPGLRQAARQHLAHQLGAQARRGFVQHQEFRPAQ